MKTRKAAFLYDERSGWCESVENRENQVKTRGGLSPEFN